MNRTACESQQAWPMYSTHCAFRARKALWSEQLCQIGLEKGEPTVRKHRTSTVTQHDMRSHLQVVCMHDDARKEAAGEMTLSWHQLHHTLNCRSNLWTMLWTDARLRQVIAQYTPVLHLHEDERYLPCSAEWYFERSQLWREEPVANVGPANMQNQHCALCDKSLLLLLPVATLLALTHRLYLMRHEMSEATQ